MTNITIVDEKETAHAADFEPIRKVRGYTIGWATVSGDDYRFRFPAIIHAGNQDFVATVSDWQAPFEEVDLADPAQVTNLIRTGQGSFIIPKTGSASVVASHFSN